MKFNVKKFVIWLAIIMGASFVIAGLVLVFTGNFTVATREIDQSKNFEAADTSEIYIKTIIWEKS